MPEIHSAVTRYQGFLAQVGTTEVRSLAQSVGDTYGTPNNPHGAGVEARALSEVLGCDRTQDACEVFRSLLEPTHQLRQRLVNYLEAHA